tara:strand:- start:586 stop:705 length:120 start_codon:yes stop_codon:yes gene_type:complete
MENMVINVISFMLMLLGYVMFGFEPTVVVLLFLIYARID